MLPSPGLPHIYSSQPQKLETPSNPSFAQLFLLLSQYQVSRGFKFTTPSSIWSSLTFLLDKYSEMLSNPWFPFQHNLNGLGQWESGWSITVQVAKAPQELNWGKAIFVVEVNCIQSYPAVWAGWGPIDIFWSWEKGSRDPGDSLRLISFLSLVDVKVEQGSLVLKESGCCGSLAVRSQDAHSLTHPYIFPHR